MTPSTNKTTNGVIPFVTLSQKITVHFHFPYFFYKKSSFPRPIQSTYEAFLQLQCINMTLISINKY